MGDFNLPEIDFSNYVVDSSEESYAMRFFELTQDIFSNRLFRKTLDI